MLKKIGFIAILISSLLYTKPGTVFSMGTTQQAFQIENNCENQENSSNSCHTETGCLCISVVNSLQIIFIEQGCNNAIHYFSSFSKKQFSYYIGFLLKGIKDEIFHPPIFD